MLTWIVRWAMVVGVCATGAVVLAGCGDDDDDDASPTDKCYQMAKTYCTRVFDCAQGSGLVQEEQRTNGIATCRDEAAQVATCNNAVDVGSTFNSCLAGLKQMACEPIVAVLQDEDGAEITMPGDCLGVIKVTSDSVEPGSNAALPGVHQAMGHIRSRH